VPGKVSRHSCKESVIVLTTTAIYQQILVKFPNMKLHENLLSGSQVVICGQAETMGLMGALL
jgi:hypothetical protein